MTTDGGTVVFDESINMQRFPPSRHGVLLGQTVANVGWLSLDVTMKLSYLSFEAGWLATVVASSRTMTGTHVQSSGLEPTF